MQSSRQALVQDQEQDGSTVVKTDESILLPQGEDSF